MPIARRPNYKWWAFAAIAAGTLASVIDHGSVNIALPSIARHFGTDIPSVQWVVIAYALTITSLLLPMGRLADLIGLRKVYLLGSVVFLLGALVAGSSSNLWILILSRVLQGAGAAMTQGTGLAIVAGAFPESERGKAIGSIMTIVGTGGIAGPALGGFLVGAIGWRWVFFAPIPLVAVGVVAVLAILDNRRLIPEDPDSHRSGFDWLGAALSTGILLVFLLAATNGRVSGWTSPPMLVAVLSLVALLITFIWWEFHCSSPILDLRLFASRTFSFGVSANFLNFLGSSAILFLAPFYLQRVLGYSAAESGLVVVPSAICLAVLSPLAGRLSDRYGWRLFTVGGLALSATGLFLLSRLDEGSSLPLVVLTMMFQGSGMGVFYTPNSSSILSVVERESYGVVSSFLNLVRNAGNVISIAVATAIVTATMAGLGFEPSLEMAPESGAVGATHAFVLGIQNSYLTMMGLLLLGMVISIFKFEKGSHVKPGSLPPPLPGTDR